MQHSGCVLRVLLCKQHQFGEKNCNSSGDMKYFGGNFTGRTSHFDFSISSRVSDVVGRLA